MERTMTCLVCGSKMNKDKKMKGLERCPQCGFVSADISLNKEELEEIYSEEYFKGAVYTDYLADAMMQKRNFQKRVNKIKEHFPGDVAEASVLEIGCAYGLFLEVLSSYGVRDLRGIDISRDAVESAKERMNGLAGVTQGDYLQFPTEECSRDIICLWDTIEHLVRPDEYIRKASAEMKSGGLLCVTTGDIESLNARIRGSKWRQIHPPEHLHYFSKKTLTHLLERYGFTTIHFSYIGNELSLRDVVHAVCSHMGKHELYDKVKCWRIMNMRVSIYLRDYMFVIGKKR